MEYGSRVFALNAPPECFCLVLYGMALAQLPNHKGACKPGSCKSLDDFASCVAVCRSTYDNALDMAHIHYVHNGSFGNPDKPEIMDMNIERDTWGITGSFKIFNKPVSPSRSNM